MDVNTARAELIASTWKWATPDSDTPIQTKSEGGSEQLEDEVEFDSSIFENNDTDKKWAQKNEEAEIERQRKASWEWQVNSALKQIARWEKTIEDFPEKIQNAINEDEKPVKEFDMEAIVEKVTKSVLSKVEQEKTDTQSFSELQSKLPSKMWKQQLEALKSTYAEWLKDWLKPFTALKYAIKDAWIKLVDKESEARTTAKSRLSLPAIGNPVWGDKKKDFWKFQRSQAPSDWYKRK